MKCQLTLLPKASAHLPEQSLGFQFSGEYHMGILAAMWVGLIDSGYSFAEDCAPHAIAQRDEARRILAMLSTEVTA